MSVPECDRLDDYLLGGLPTEEAARFEAHLAGCPACRDELQRQKRVDRLLAQGTGQLEPVPAWLIDRVEEQFRRSHRRRVVRLAWGLSAAVLVVSALVVWLARGGLETSNSRQPVAEGHPEPVPDGKQIIQPGREAPPPGPVARVTLDDPSEAILVPMETETPNITVVWIYPTVKPVQPPEAPDND